MITVVIIAKNEAEQLKLLLPTLSWADSILIVDNNSTDETMAVGKVFKAKVIRSSIKDNYAKLRNLALKVVKSGWVLFLDADERVPAETAAELCQIGKKRSVKHKSYQIRRVDVFYGKRLEFGETGQQWLTRFGRVKAGRWIRPVHEVWQTKNPGRLKNEIIHHSHRNISEFIQSVKRYARIEASYRKRNKLPWSLIDTVVYPVGKFVKTFFVNQGYRDGWRGAVMSLGMSYHSFLVRKNLFSAWFPAQNAPYAISVLKILLLAIVGLLPFGQFSRVITSLPFNLYAFEPLMAFVIILWLLIMGLYRKSPSFPSFSTSLFFMAYVLLLSLFANLPLLPYGTILMAFAYWLRLMLYLVFGLVLYDVYDRKWLSFPIDRILVYSGVSLALGGLIQYVFIPDTRWLFYLGWDDHFFRAIGTLLDPGFLSLILALTLIVLWLSAIPYAKLCMGIVYVAFLLTYARSGYVVFFTGLVSLVLIRKMKLAQFLGISLLFGLSLWLLPSPGGEGVNLTRTYSIVSRAKSVVTAMDLFGQFPILGVGFNAYKHYALSAEHPLDLPVNPSAPDNSLALVLATSGTVGLASFMWFYFRFWWSGRKVPIVWISLVMIFLHSLTNNSFFYPWVMLWVAGIMPLTKEK